MRGRGQSHPKHRRSLPGSNLTMSITACEFLIRLGNAAIWYTSTIPQTNLVNSQSPHIPRHNLTVKL
ncbi:hypothetical protein BJV77DRAFT_999465, partial [Russula vinacea]